MSRNWIDSFSNKTFYLNVTIPHCLDLNSTAKIDLVFNGFENMNSVMFMYQFASRCNSKHCDCSIPIAGIANDNSNMVCRIFSEIFYVEIFIIFIIFIVYYFNFLKFLLLCFNFLNFIFLFFLFFIFFILILFYYFDINFSYFLNLYFFNIFNYFFFYRNLFNNILYYFTIIFN